MRREAARFMMVLAVAVTAGAGYFFFKPPAAVGLDITERAKQAPPPEAATLSATLISNEDLPPAGTRSLFDHLIAQNEALPYPFEKLIALLQRYDPEGAPPVAVMIPQGRSLLKASADFAHPRVLVTADYQAPNTETMLGLAPRGRLFLGFVEDAHEIEVLSYNESAGRFEFQLVQNYCENCVPRIVYARRAICTTCHQNAAPIFPERPWSETNGQPEIANKLALARNNAAYLSLPLATPLSAPERFDELTDVGNFVTVTQRLWIDGCGSGAPGIACRRQMLRLALQYLWNPAEFDTASVEAHKLRQMQATSWPAGGITVGQSDLRNRDPLGERRGFKGYIRTLFAPKAIPGAGAKNNEDLEAFDKLPKLPAKLDPLTLRAPKRLLRPDDIDGAFGLAAMLTESDFKLVEAATGYDLQKLLALPDAIADKFFEPAVFSRIALINAALPALGKAPLEYCCLSTAEMSPPVVSGLPPIQIAEASVLKHYEQYCFACHRGNPSQRLDFMAGANEVEVLAQIKQRPEIRDALDWERYKGSDKANKLMPPADSHQHKALQEALKGNPKLLEEMQAAVPGLFDF